MTHRSLSTQRHVPILKINFHLCRFKTSAQAWYRQVSQVSWDDYLGGWWWRWEHDDLLDWIVVLLQVEHLSWSKDAILCNLNLLVLNLPARSTRSARSVIKHIWVVSSIILPTKPFIHSTPILNFQDCALIWHLPHDFFIRNISIWHPVRTVPWA